jgi:hypothetical protein
MRKTSIRTLLPVSILAVLATAAGWSQAPAAAKPSQPAGQAGAAKTPESNVANPQDFLTLYPGQYTEREKAAVEKFLADNKAIADRGPIDVKALIHGTLPNDTPGLVGTLQVTEAMVRYDNNKYDPDNRLLTDAAYAKSLGYENIQALPTFAACDDLIMKPYPINVRDTLLVSQLNHNIRVYKPIYPGNTLYTVMNSRDLYDITPAQGSIYRSLIIVNQASIYNQKGEKVNDVTFRVVEMVKLYKPGLGPKNPGFKDIWEAPNWLSRPEHVYTAKDWETIKGLWAKEKRQGAAPLYWEDVKVGDQPTWTVDGPIIKSVTPTSPYGMGTGGSRTMRKEIMDPATFKTMILDKATGIYLLPNEADYVPKVPDQQAKPGEDAAAPGGISTADIHKQTSIQRAALINYFGRDIALRHIDNWMGDHGTITDIRWGIMEPETHAAFGKIVERSPFSEDFLSHVPYMKGKHVSAHGLTTDVAIVKSYVYNKYVLNGEHFVDLAWWVESIEGYIWEAGGATVKLPSKNACLNQH